MRHRSDKSVLEIGRRRLANQSIAASACRAPEQVVSALGAMQAQDYPGALWSVGLRWPGATESAVEQAIAARKIVRTWLMRGTLHLVAAADVRWMLDLLTPRLLANAASRAARLELDAKILARCEKLFVRELSGNRQLTRETLMALLERNKISTANMRGYHILWRLAQEGVIVFAARSGRSQTFALLDEWVAPAKKPDRADALAELARRYFTSHGPALMADFAGWSGLKMTDARTGVADAAPALSSETIDGLTYWGPRNSMKLKAGGDGFLLPGFDEFILGYKERDAVLEARHAEKIVPGSNGVFLPTVILQGRVAGIWKRTVRKEAVVITVNGFKLMTKADKQAVAAAADRYGQFLGLPVEVN